MSLQILIIDDDHAFEQLLVLRLKSFIEDPQILHFPSLSAAREFLRSAPITQFDLVILDEHLPDGRGAAFLDEGWFQDLAVLSVSSDDAPEIPGKTLKAGAAYFLNKRTVSQPLFRPLVEGIIDRNRLSKELNQAKVTSAVMDSVKTLISTLRHEINNPLGAVLGAAYLLRKSETSSPEQKEAAELVESSGKRIKHVLEQLCQAMALEPVTKANQKVFHIPGDKPWETK